MRKVLLMLALAMLGVALFASAALAQGVWTPPPSVNPTTGCPHMWVPLPSGECVPVSDPRATDDTPSASPTATPSATASATAAADSQYSAPSLPSTGGVFPALAFGSLVLLVVGGLFAAGIVRRV